MNYQKHYDQLIENATNRSIIPTEYKESHHIIPRSIGGTDETENLVDLFPEEHLVAHLLLVKIHPNNDKMIYAANMMSSFHGVNNKKYAWLKKQHSELMKKNNPMHNEETRQKMIESCKGRVPWHAGLTKDDERVKSMTYERTDKHRELARKGRLGTKMPEASRQRMIKEKTGKPNFKNAKSVILVKPNGEELLIKHRIAEKYKELGLSYRTLNKFRNGVVPPSNRKNSPHRHSTTGWCLKDIRTSLTKKSKAH